MASGGDQLYACTNDSSLYAIRDRDFGFEIVHRHRDSKPLSCKIFSSYACSISNTGQLVLSNELESKVLLDIQVLSRNQKNHQPYEFVAEGLLLGGKQLSIFDLAEQKLKIVKQSQYGKILNIRNNRDLGMVFMQHTQLLQILNYQLVEIFCIEINSIQFDFIKDHLIYIEALTLKSWDLNDFEEFASFKKRKQFAIQDNEVQEVGGTGQFQSGSYLCEGVIRINGVGSISLVGDNQILVQFWDREFHKSISILNKENYIIGDLSTEALILCSQKEEYSEVLVKVFGETDIKIEEDPVALVQLCAYGFCLCKQQ